MAIIDVMVIIVETVTWSQIALLHLMVPIVNMVTARGTT